VSNRDQAGFQVLVEVSALHYWADFWIAARILETSAALPCHYHNKKRNRAWLSSNADAPCWNFKSPQKSNLASRDSSEKSTNQSARSLRPRLILPWMRSRTDLSRKCERVVVQKQAHTFGQGKTTLEKEWIACGVLLKILVRCMTGSPPTRLPLSLNILGSLYAGYKISHPISAAHSSLTL
jgi:hypothetical protein